MLTLNLARTDVNIFDIVQKCFHRKADSANLLRIYKHIVSLKYKLEKIVAWIIN